MNEKTEAEKYETRKKVFRLFLAIFLVVNISGIVFLIINHVKEYNKEIAYNKFSNEISEDIEYQVGNYVSGGVYANGYTYVLVPKQSIAYGQKYYESGKWNPEANEVLYRIDRDGVCEKFCLPDYHTLQRDYRMPYIYYYNGWIYFSMRNMEAKYSESIIVRVSEDLTSMETIYKSDYFTICGIRDGYLIISDNHELYRLNMDDVHDLSKIEKLEKYDPWVCVEPHPFFLNWIYNCKKWDSSDSQFDYRKYNDETDYSEYAEYLRQYHDGNIYTLMRNEEYAGLDSYKHMDLVKRTYVDNGKYSYPEEIIVSGVTCFNIFDDKLYYVTGSDGDNIVWCSDLNGENKEKLYQTDFEEEMYCKNMVVSDYNIICDFAINYRDDYDEICYTIMKRCIINNETGNVNIIEF